MQTPTRIAHVLRKYDPEAWGGTETHVVALTAALRGHGIQAEVHAPKGPLAADQALAPWVPLRRFHAFTPFLGTSERRRALREMSGNIASIEEPLRLAFDEGLALTHVHTLGRIGGGVRTAMRLTGRPYVVSVHGPLLGAPEILSSDVKRRLSGTIDLGKPLGWLLGARRVLDDAARVICFNEEERAALAERIGDRAVRFDHGVDVGRFGGGSIATAASLWPELGTDPVVLLVGRLSEQKNQRLALAAFARVRMPARLVFAGAETDHAERARLEREARALGIRERVHFLGNVSPSNVPHLIARAAVSITPSVHEAFGLVVLEAWAAERAVLFARRSGLADLADALGEPGWAIDSLDVDAWSVAIERALDDGPSRASVARRGRALVEQRFSWTAVAKRTADLYREVIEGRYRARAA
jgi:glycosyltransferase involved in cell wall biosynthesis